MRKYISFILVLFFALVSCTDQELCHQGAVGDKEVWSTIHFGHESYEQINITTRATLNEIAESRVENLYVYVFDADGNRLYSHFYDYTNRKEALPTQAGNYWTVSNRTSNNDNDTQGEIMIKSPVMEGGSIYILANLNADQLNISADQLNIINSLDELQALSVTLNQEITSRTGYFLMQGEVDGVTIDDNGNVTADGKSVIVPLVRLDAKVTVNVQVGDAKLENQVMKDFVPQSWQVMRLPKETKVLSSDSNVDVFDCFDAPEVYFESDLNGVKSFSFYMLENKRMTSTLTSYNQRDMRRKKLDGTYDLNQGLWLHAPEDATYLVIKGKIQMEVDTNIEGGLHYLEADVVYYVHLGNFGNSESGGDCNDFTINRNTHYTYTITITGVNSIEVEVTQDEENQSGATGHVYKSKEEIYTFDAHYGQRVFRIDADDVNPEKITWYVKTPFGRQGTPAYENTTTIPDLDYKWVKFLLNEKEYNGVYSTENRWYPGDEGQALKDGEVLMDVVSFIEFLKKEKLKYDAAEVDEKPNASAFHVDNNGVYCLYVTAFVNEYYYEADPLNSENKPQDLWKLFVNQPNRLMHILSDTQKSKDEASSMTSSILTIRQRSIQTPYNLTKDELKTAFGCETVDETRPFYFSFYENDDNYKGVDLGNNSTNNGLYNTACLWNLFNGGTVKTEANREKWSTYLDYSVANNETSANHFLLESMESMRYAPMSRNRDNNGNGYIDPEEVRWYIAPLEQLYTLYVGDLGLVSEAQLYPSSLATLSNSQDNQGKWQWRNHIVCSNQTTITNSGQFIDQYWPEMLWAEEGVSISGYGQEWSKLAPNSIRCVRNLGMEDATEETIGSKELNIPTPMINVTTSSDSKVYYFDLSNMNDRSARYFTSQELIPGNENDESSRTYYGFETDNEFISYSGNYSTLRSQLEAGNSPSTEGYRVPNVREAALMSLFCSEDWWGDNSILSCSYYSHGSLGTQYDGDEITWFFQSKYITISGNAGSLCCVKDWRPE